MAYDTSAAKFTQAVLDANLPVTAPGIPQLRRVLSEQRESKDPLIPNS